MRTLRALLVLVGLGLASQGASAQSTDPDLSTDAVPADGDVLAGRPKSELPEAKTLEPALRRAFDHPNGFCKSLEYDLSEDEWRLCELAPAAAERCPGFVHACQKHDEGGELASGSGHGSGRRDVKGKRGPRASERDGTRGHREAEERDDESRRSVQFSAGPLGEILGAIIKVIFWALLVLGIGTMAFAGISALLRRKKDAKSESLDEGTADATVVPVTRQAPPGSPEALLALAGELAREGELKAATAVLLRALLRHLEIRGWLELHPSRTNGDYVRSLRRNGHDPVDLRRVAAAVEAIEFGGGQASADAFSTLHARVSKLVQASGILLALVVFGALTGCRRHHPPEDAVSSCGTDASGYSALCETLGVRGVKFRRRFSAIQSIAEDVGRVVVLDDDLEAIERKVLLDWVDAGGTLVVFAGASSYDERLRTLVPCGNELTLEAQAWNVVGDAKRRFELPKTRTFLDLAGARTAVRCGKGPFALEVTRGNGTIVAIADGRFPTNASLAIGDNAALAASLVAPPGAVVELVGAWTGSGSDVPVESLTRAGLLPWFLHVLLLCFALALYRGSPFGSRREPVTVTRRAFAEHAVALGDAYSRARASRIALVNFGGWALERLRVRLQATKHGRLSDLAGAVAARHSVSEGEVMSLVVAVRSAEDQAHDSATEAEHLAALRRLSALVKKTGGPS